MKHVLLILTIALLSISCKKEQEPSYYSFQGNDNLWFTIYDVGDTITFISDTAPQKKYVVRNIFDNRKNEMGPKLYLVTSTPRVDYYYDSRTINLSLVNESKYTISYSIRMSRSPVYDYAHRNFNKNIAINNFAVSVFLDEYNSATFSRDLTVKSIYAPLQYIPVNIDGVMYNEVAYFNSNNVNSFCHTCHGFNLPNSKPLRINQIWYQRQFGIIQFSDLEGNTWKIKR